MPDHGKAPAKGRDGSRTVRLALRWMLILATALLTCPPGQRPLSRTFDVLLLLGFVASNIALMFLQQRWLRSRGLEYMIVIADTFLVSLALFRAAPDGAHLPLVFFLTLALAALGGDLLRISAGTTLVAALYAYLTWRGGASGAADLTAVLLRVPFLYVVGLYYGHLVHEARLEQDRTGRIELEKRDLETFLEITSAATSTLDLNQVLYIIVRRIASLVDALRCSILTVDEPNARCHVLASSDNPNVSGLSLDLGKYPEVRRAVETREAVVINDVEREPLLDHVRDKLHALGFHSIIVLPLISGNSLLGMLFLRAARREQRFSDKDIAACKVVANASANALKNAMLYEQARAEATSRKETADKLQNVLDHFPDLIYTTDGEGRVTEFSRGGEGMLGYGRREALGLGFADLYSEAAARERLQRVLREGLPVQSLETTVRRRDGSSQDVMVAAAPLRDWAGRVSGSVGIIKNITDLKAARRHLVQAEKLSALGEVVSGVAHELNNPLAGVLGYAQLLMSGQMDAKQQRSVERIFESALRCQKIVQNLLAFARQHPSEKKYLGLNGIVEKTLDLKAYQLRVNNIQVTKRLDPDLPRTMLDFNQIQQVMLNVINNAQYSISRDRGRGALAFSTSSRDDVLRLEVADDGPGIPEKILGKVFDPFFTTKPVGEGTGLGLSVSYGIVQAHGGRIWVESNMGRGTVVLIELPIQTPEEVREEDKTLSPDQRAAPPEALRILAVDDEPVILDLILDALGRDGHRVDTASSAREALQKLERSAYDVVVCDLKMPEMDGQQLYEVLRSRWPDIARRVIFASGDTIHPDTRSFIDRTGRPCVDKPFKLEALAAAITDVARADSGRRSSAASA